MSIEVYAAQPREGTETFLVFARSPNNAFYGLCSSTPRGDGNTIVYTSPLRDVIVSVYAAQPREGTETPTGSGG